MSAVRGWCPDLFTPMPSGDGLLLRVKPRLGRIGAQAAIALSQAALRFGNGRIEITNRGNLQFRGFSEPSAVGFADATRGLGLADADPGVERRRNILVSPLAGVDPACSPDVIEIALTLQAALADPAFAGLAGKFGFLVDGGGLMPLASVGADIALRAGEHGWRVEAGGAFVAGTAAATAGIALQLALSLAPGARPSRDPRGGLALFAGAGHAATPIEDALPVLPPTAVGPIGRSLFGIGAPPGQFDATAMRVLAELSVRFGDGVLRPTPFRSIVVGGFDLTGLRALRTVLSDRLIAPDDPRLRTASCIGRPGCMHATVAAPADAARLAPLVPELLPGGGLLHVSGCDKGCGHPGPAPIVLVGRDGRYDLVRDGCAGDTPVLRDIAPEAAAAVLGGFSS